MMWRRLFSPSLHEEGPRNAKKLITVGCLDMGRKEMLRILSHPDLPTPQQFPLSRRTSGKKKGTKQGTDE